MEQNTVENTMEPKVDKKKIAIIVAAVIAVLAVIYLGLSIYFMDHFYFRTKIGNVDVSGKSAAAAEKELQQALDEYELTIKERDGKTDSIVGDEIDLTIEWNKKPSTYIENHSVFQYTC